MIQPGRYVVWRDERLYSDDMTFTWAVSLDLIAIPKLSRKNILVMGNMLRTTIGICMYVNIYAYMCVL